MEQVTDIHAEQVVQVPEQEPVGGEGHGGPGVGAVEEFSASELAVSGEVGFYKGEFAGVFEDVDEIVGDEVGAEAEGVFTAAGPEDFAKSYCP